MSGFDKWVECGPDRVPLDLDVGDEIWTTLGSAPLTIVETDLRDVLMPYKAQSLLGESWVPAFRIRAFRRKVRAQPPAQEAAGG